MQQDKRIKELETEIEILKSNVHDLHIQLRDAYIKIKELK